MMLIGGNLSTLELPEMLLASDAYHGMNFHLTSKRWLCN
jgi:hypothetical protein